MKNNKDINPFLVNTTLPNNHCEGNCLVTHGEHTGAVERVLVSGMDTVAMEFFYCQNAIQEDESRGFKVERCYK